MQTEIKKTYHENGKLMGKHTFFNGKRHGNQKSFYPNGTLSHSWLMINGRDYGLEQSWWINTNRHFLRQLKK